MADTARVLLVEDDESVGPALSTLLKQERFEATWVTSAEAALKTLEKRAFDVVISDVRMDGMSGLELLRHLRPRFPDLPVVLLTAHGTVEMAVEAMRDGAADFLQKPCQRDQLTQVLRRTLDKTAAERGAPPKQATPQPVAGDGMVGRSAKLAAARELISKVAPKPTTVLVQGATGTGKELVARAVHALSPRAKKPFVVLNCSAIPANLFESELFGYDKGAFTGAATDKPGRIELADGGTLFLDEVGELPLEVQPKLLRFLQERTFTRVGPSAAERKADVRVVAATHRDLEQMVRDGRFREDLYFRLNVIRIELPDLAERREDIEPLVRHFLTTLSARLGQAVCGLTPAALALLEAQPWSGNIRQLENFIERLLVLAPPGDLEADFVKGELASAGLGAQAAAATGATGDSLDERRRLAERAAVEEALAKAKGNRTTAARLLGVSRRTLYNKLDELGLAES